ncbi:MAG: peptide deformylase [Atopobiaceae bacterium]|uniref:peptide deformylase n=1 Tax=Tractidigestivibacter sp. TaxID=2847320 RepID=UPI002A7F92A1|nr:peptide deformylase [Tractidigestivibacter sp.]MCI6274269.1 peptide deformylase [Coriobacteriaceae bacterium]MDY3901597.1 peptide deformylase [Atopobiaceae bacterium]MCI6843412.1 peptide deformylase [Coriobacteriaceae bacterium]MCI7437939.1 peptide deformylase [Coriobacteriaceae bacterium]MDD7583766.1 peptide deformylase [Coriobacteriaceae bacterium]
MNPLDDIVLSPAPVLSEECAPVEEIDDEIRALAKRMLRDMYAADGCGLAAPQVGVARQVVVIDVEWSGRGSRKNPYVLINPRVITADGPERITGEGCLSFPGVTVEVERPSHVVVQALNLDGDLMQYEASGNLLAVCLQHEIDHLHGVTMMDHLSASARVRAMAEYQDALNAGARPGDVEVEEG